MTGGFQPAWLFSSTLEHPLQRGPGAGSEGDAGGNGRFRSLPTAAEEASGSPSVCCQRGLGEGVWLVLSW